MIITPNFFSQLNNIPDNAAELGITGNDYLTQVGSLAGETNGA